MTTERITFLTVFETYLMYSEASGQYHQLDEEDKKIVKPSIDHLKQKWQGELKNVCLLTQGPSMKRIDGKKLL